jgi:hypothetical protein
VHERCCLIRVAKVKNARPSGAEAASLACSTHRFKTSAGPLAEYLLAFCVTSSHVVGSEESPFLWCPPQGLISIGSPSFGVTVWGVFNCANRRASASLSARTQIGSGLHIFHRGSDKSVGVSFQIRMAQLLAAKVTPTYSASVRNSPIAGLLHRNNSDDRTLGNRCRGVNHLPVQSNCQPRLRRFSFIRTNGDGLSISRNTSKRGSLQSSDFTNSNDPPPAVGLS